MGIINVKKKTTRVTVCAPKHNKPCFRQSPTNKFMDWVQCVCLLLSQLNNVGGRGQCALFNFVFTSNLNKNDVMQDDIILCIFKVSYCDGRNINCWTELYYSYIILSNRPWQPFVYLATQLAVYGSMWYKVLITAGSQLLLSENCFQCCQHYCNREATVWSGKPS